VKRKTSAFLERAKESLELAIEVFNRPSETARVEGVLLFLEHAFEMLLKAVLLEKTGRVRSPRQKFNYGFEKCLNIVQTQLGLIDKDEALVLQNLNGFRDAAAHDLVEISEGLLYGHAQSAIQIFAALLKKVFSQDLGRVLPRRVLPLSTVAPTDINAIVAEDMAAVMAMLGHKKRREDEAEARLRPYQVVEKNIRSVQGVSRDAPSLARMIRGLKAGDWKTILPMVAGLVQPTTGGIPFTLHVSKKDGFPVRIDPLAPTAIAFRYIKPEDKYPYLTRELAEKLGTSTAKAVGLAKLFDMKGKDDFHTSIKVSRTGLVSRYSEKARQIMGNALTRHGADDLWARAKAGQRLNPRDYLTDASGQADARSVAAASEQSA